MSYAEAPDEVADDFRNALCDLSINSRYEISNLTIIAKENTEHAFAIAEALKSHIKQVGQIFFFLLDSLVYILFYCFSFRFCKQFAAITYTSVDIPAEEASRFLCP